MKILFVVKQKKNVDTFLRTIRALVDRGHSVALAVQDGDELPDELAEEVAAPGLRLVRCPSTRMDEWVDVAPLLRSMRDCAHYLQPELHDALKLQSRVVHALRSELRIPGETRDVVGNLLHIPSAQIERVESILRLAEAHLPADPLYDEFIAQQAPDVLLVSPLVHFRSAQADLVAAARARGIPVGMLLFSWDNLSTKGCLHRPPDWMFAWNEGQRREAAQLHGFPADRVLVVGAPRFDTFFALAPRTSREAFHEPLGLDPARPTLLYVCSSAFVASGELAFVRKWVGEIRGGVHEGLRAANIVIRPHPDIALLPPEEPMEVLRWPALRGLKGYVARPFADRRAIVLRTADRVGQGLYECISHAAAVVGLNTSAELEAAIVGRPVFTILAGERDADGQSGTLHFHYLTEEHGGFVRVGRSFDEHLQQVSAELESPTDPARLREFVAGFLRPLGIEAPVAPALAEAIERTFQQHQMVRGEVEPPGPIESRRGEASPSVAPPQDQGPTIAVALTGPALRVHVPAYQHGDGGKYRVDRSTLEWLQRDVMVGDIVYDIGAGIGVYALIAAKHRGAVVVAFEPGYAAFKLLCDNLLENGADGTVIPLPVALSNGERLAELKYAMGRPGHQRHTLRDARWRATRSAGTDRAYIQPVLTTSVDRAVAAYGLPRPAHFRIGEGWSVSEILSGAAAVISGGSVRTMFLTVATDRYDELVSTVAPQAWEVSAHMPISRGRSHVLLRRPGAVGRSTTETPQPSI